MLKWGHEYVDKGPRANAQRDWQQAGVWHLSHVAPLDRFARNDQIDWSRAVVDSCSVRAVYGGNLTGPNPTDRAKRDPTLARRTRATAAAA